MEKIISRWRVSQRLSIGDVVFQDDSIKSLSPGKWNSKFLSKYLFRKIYNRWWTKLSLKKSLMESMRLI